MFDATLIRHQMATMSILFSLVVEIYIRSFIYEKLRCINVLASAVHILKLERYRED